MRLLFELFASFFRIGLFTFGGGYAMLPILTREVADKRGWATKEELLQYYAIGQCTPGIIAINTATFVGFSQKRALGGIFATLGMVAPSLLIITALASGLSYVVDIPAVQSALAGIGVAVVALIASAVCDMFKSGVKSLPQGLVFAAACLLSVFLKVTPVLLLAAAAAFGLIFGKKGAK